MVIGLWALFCAPGSAGDMSGYNRLLSSMRGDIAALIGQERKQPGSSTRAIKRLSVSIPTETSVSVRGQKPMHVDLRWVRDGLYDAAALTGKSRVQKLESLADRAHTYQQAARLMPGISASVADRSKNALRDVLSRREYQTSTKEQLWQKIIGFLYRHLENLHVPDKVTNAFSWVLLAIIAVALVIALVWIVWRIVYVANMGDSDEARRGQAVVAPGVISQSEILEMAERAADEGRYNEAFRGIYLAAILALDRAKLVKYVDGATNWEYLSALNAGQNQDAVKVFKPMTMSFDKLIYGKRQVSERDFGECAERYRMLEGAL